MFLNVPFDRAYEPLYCALVASVVGIGGRPRSVLEISASGRVRLSRLASVIRECRASIHDLSRVQLSSRVPRFNMPFELGLAMGYALTGPPTHSTTIFESTPYRLQRSLSDVNGIDPEIHRNSIRGVVLGLLNALRPRQDPDRLIRLAREAARAGRQLKREVGTLYSRVAFTRLVVICTRLAESHGLIARH